jgi:hypothetical protein
MNPTQSKAARSCAQFGNALHAVQILIDFEGRERDAQDLFKAARDPPTPAF